MIKRITLDELIRRCKAAGINVSRITRDYAYVKENTAPRSQHLLTTLNPFRFPEMPPAFKNYVIDSKWKDDGGMHSLQWYIDNNKRIHAIKIIRANTGLGLADCVHIYNYWCGI